MAGLPRIVLHAEGAQSLCLPYADEQKAQSSLARMPAELAREREIVAAAVAAWQAHHERLTAEAQRARQQGLQALEALRAECGARREALEREVAMARADTGSRERELAVKHAAELRRLQVRHAAARLAASLSSGFVREKGLTDLLAVNRLSTQAGRRKEMQLRRQRGSALQCLRSS